MHKNGDFEKLKLVCLQWWSQFKEHGYLTNTQ